MRRSQLVIPIVCIAVLVLSVLTVGITAFADHLTVDDYDFYTEVEVYNSGSTASDTWIPVTMNPDGLSSGAFMRTDAADVLAADQNNAELSSFLQNTASATGTWWIRATTLTGAGTTTLAFHHGNSTDTKDQALSGVGPGGGGDLRG